MCSRCQEIRQIVADGPTVDRGDRGAIPVDEELLGSPDPALVRLEGTEDQAARKTLRTSSLDRFPVQRLTRKNRRAVACEALMQLFPSDEKIRTLQLWGPMTDRQVRVLEEFLFLLWGEEWWGDEQLSWTTRCERIADYIGGCSRQTVSRDLDGVIDHVWGRAGAPGAEPGTYAVTRERGSRQREVWVTRVDCIGAWSRSCGALVTDEATRRRVLQEQPPS